MRFDCTLGFPGEGPGPGVLKRVFDYVTSFGMEWQNNSIQAFNGTKFVVTVPYLPPTTSPHSHGHPSPTSATFYPPTIVLHPPKPITTISSRHHTPTTHHLTIPSPSTHQPSSATLRPPSTILHPPLATITLSAQPKQSLLTNHRPPLFYTHIDSLYYRLLLVSCNPPPSTYHELSSTHHLPTSTATHHSVGSGGRAALWFQMQGGPTSLVEH
jgi:hypothetical protein